ncbi:MAG TPA: NAD(P)H-dependent glycerol-3-phosphate dehydrogenase [Burkholderiales bacterium]|nr:NAD(P)H-dependent glycerol-3-phosphate dehydrogenase [Burkholderiales bacterium]
MARVAVVGGGAFGTATACVIRRSGHDVVLWAREPDVVEDVNTRGVNSAFLAGIPLVPGLRATGDFAEAVAGAALVVLAVPAQFVRSIASQLRPMLPEGMPVVSCAKGVERESCALMPEVIAEALPASTIAVLSGPALAREIAADLPTGVTLACESAQVGQFLARTIGTPRFRTYLSEDVIGVAIGGAMNNVLGVACGIVEGRKLGQDARATLLTRGLAEMAALGRAKGAKLRTFMGLSGVGDLTLTCNDLHARNTSLGVAIGQGQNAHDIIAGRKVVTEGFFSVQAVAALARRLGIEMPISQALDEVLNHDADVDGAIGRLLARPYDFEWGMG